MGALAAPIAASGFFAGVTPLTLISVGSTIFSGLSSAGAAGDNAAAQQAQLQAQADTASFNASVSRENAKIVEQQTASELQRADRERRLRVGANIASAGASGIGIGSLLDTMQSSAAQEELNLLTIESEGLLKKRSFEQNASLDGASSKNTLNQIPMVKKAGKTRSASAILGGISSGVSTAKSMGAF